MTENKAIEHKKGNMAVDVVGDFPAIMQMADVLVKSGFLPRGVDTPQKCAAIIIRGQEMGLSPMVSLEHLNVVNGKVGMSAEIMRALILERVPGSKISIKKNTTEICTLVAERPGQSPTEFSFTMEEAKRITRNGRKLVDGDGWKNYPADMLLARATSRMKRGYFPDVNITSYTPDEVTFDITGGVDQNFSKYQQKPPTIAPEHDKDDNIVDGEVVDEVEHIEEEPETEGVDSMALRERLKNNFPQQNDRISFVQGATGKVVKTVQEWEQLNDKDYSVISLALDKFEEGGE